MRILIGLVVLAAALTADVRPGYSRYWQGNAPWCIQPPGLGSMWSCSYYSLEQCQATNYAGRGHCVPNPTEYWAKRGFFTQDSKAKKKSTRKKRTSTQQR
jgi:hypothetical protein